MRVRHTHADVSNALQHTHGHVFCLMFTCIRPIYVSMPVLGNKYAQKLLTPLAFELTIPSLGFLETLQALITPITLMSWQVQFSKAKPMGRGGTGSSSKECSWREEGEGITYW